jgi:hypothetical protein
MPTNNNRPISGTKALKQPRVIKAVGNNVKKIRCPNCKELAHPVPDGKGGKIIRCKYCRQDFKFLSI